MNGAVSALCLDKKKCAIMFKSIPHPPVFPCQQIVTALFLSTTVLCKGNSQEPISLFLLSQMPEYFIYVCKSKFSGNKFPAEAGDHTPYRI
jgi:hypothetical protein